MSVDVIWLIIGVVALAAVIVAVVMVFVWRRRNARRRALLLRQMPLHLVGLPRTRDREADKAIKEVRDRLVFNWSEKTPFNPKDFYALSLDVTEQIARVYYPDAEEPLKKASISALMDLNRRVTRRVRGLLETPPFNLLGKVDLGLIMSVKKGAKDILNSPIVQWIKDSPVGSALGAIGKRIPKLWRAARVASKGLTPARLAFEVGKDITVEGAKRLFVSSLVGIVAEEAITIYSGRFVSNEQAKTELLTLYAIARILRDQGSISAAEHRILLRQAVSLKRLDPDLRLFFIDYARGATRGQDALIDEVVHQSRVAAGLKSQEERSAEDDTAAWERFCRFEDFSPVRALAGEKIFLTALEEFAAADGADRTNKLRILEQARRDLSI